MHCGILGQRATIAGGAILETAAVFECPLNLLGQLGVNMIYNINNNIPDVRFRDGSPAGITGKKKLNKLVEDFNYFISDGQICGIDKIYTTVIVVGFRNPVNEVLYFSSIGRFVRHKSILSEKTINFQTAR
jgi:hypothetical protein